MALCTELKILSHVGQHLNICRLLGAVTTNIRLGELYVIVEYCRFGNLRCFLMKNKNNFRDTMEETEEPFATGPSLTTRNLYCWAFQMARGMEYLASRKYIQRDLAARNVLLAEGNVVKICDFGLTKYLHKDPEYHEKEHGPRPFNKWMALESLTHGIYSHKRDVWSFGVLLWELFSLGGDPYPGVEINKNFIGLLGSGYRMEKPRYASDEF